MINLDKYEKQWILICKGQLKDKYPYTGYWHNTLKPLFKEIYGWDPDEDNNYRDYLWGVFSKLLDVYLKIKDDWSGENYQLKEIFAACFEPRLSNDAELPIERAIHELCSLIGNTRVIDKYNRKRFEL